MRQWQCGRCDGFRGRQREMRISWARHASPYGFAARPQAIGDNTSGTALTGHHIPMVRSLAVALFILLQATTLRAQQQGAPGTLSSSEVAAWREDLRFLAIELPRRHKNAFAHVSHADWDASVQRLDARIPQLARYEVIVELIRLV